MTNYHFTHKHFVHEFWFAQELFTRELRFTPPTYDLLTNLISTNFGLLQLMICSLFSYPQILVYFELLFHKFWFTGIIVLLPTIVFTELMLYLEL